MAFRTAPSLADRYRTFKNLAASVKSQCDATIAQTAAGNTSVYLLSSGVLGVLAEAATVFATVPSGLVAYAKIEEDDPLYDVAAEFVTMRNAIVSARDWMVTNLPASGGYLAERTVEAGGTITQRTVTPAQTAGLRTALQAVSDAIA